MLSYQKGVVKTSVRHLVEFLFRGGDITTGSSVSASPEAMLEGSRLHRKIQRGQKATYQSEVPLKMEWQEEGYDLVLEGRADGIDKTEVNKDRLSDVDGMNQTESDEEKLQHVIGMNQIESNEEKLTYVDEIKCVYRDVEEIEEADILHLAQAKCYAYMYGVKQDLEKIGVQITYCHLETEQIKRIFYCYTMGELSLWFAEVLDAYRMWAAYYVEAREKRNASIQALQFPFSFRPGQKKMTAIAYQAMENKKHIFLQAPTGVGKTISTLYPALKELGAENAENIFYLTAKTITRTVAEDTIKLLKKQGLFLSAVTITAKEKICIQEEMQCNPESCERAKGHFDRINEALYALLTAECEISQENILLFAEKYKVCPYELSFEAAVWADCIICDYNYVFDPHVNRKSLIEGSLRQNIYLIDEAHNLLDRAREMYSADIAKSDFKVPKKYFKDRNRFLFKKLGNCVMALRKLEKQAQDGTRFSLHENADAMYFPIFHLIGPLEEYLADHDNFSEREEIVEFYFKLTHFYMMLDSMDSGYEIYSEKRGRDFLLRLFCVNPSDKLEEYIENSRSSIFFSATLLPVQYYRQLLGGNRFEAYQIASPFAKENRLLAITEDVTSRYTRRGEWEYGKMIRYLELCLEKKAGNYMIFFPSYEMLTSVYGMAEQSNLALVSELIVQEPSMEERSREAFLEKFREQSGKPLIGFCVLGSIFSEGIDLTGNSLIGVLIVGTGLPQICNEREVIRAYFDRQQKKGYDYAYRYPGMNKVLQAAGRVIRTAEDVGTILLMDERFLERDNQSLLPEEWESYYAVNRNNCGQVLENFWNGLDNDKVAEAES